MKRGSTWHCWDLHVHSPASYESDFDAPAEDETWEEYATALAGAAREHQVAAVSLQDYFTTLGYDELVSRDLYNPDERVIYGDEGPQSLLIIPGVELRLDNFTDDDTALNTHLYFDPSVYIEGTVREFMSNMECLQHGDHEISSDTRSLIQYGYARRADEDIDRSLTPDDLRPHERYAALHRAASEATVSLSELKQAVEGYKKYHNLHRMPLLIGVASSGYGAVSELGWEGRAGAIRRDITRFADFILSSNENDRKFYLGKHPDAPQELLQEEIGGCKPCVSGSDAHDLETLLHPSEGDTERYLWIKAEPTFEGLRQLRHEPSSRVRVQEESPQTKAQYRTIEKLSLNSPEYADCDVHFNRDLTVIIGGKSTGKSFLLYGLAATMNHSEAAERQIDEKTVEWYDNALEEADAEVVWDDETSFSFQEGAQSRAVSYIPQGYINRLAEHREELNKFVLEVLSGKDGFSRLREDLEETISEIRDTIRENGNELLDVISERRDLAEERKRLGDREGIEAEVDQLEDELERLEERSSMNSEQREDYEELKKARDRLEESLENTELSLDVLDALQDDVESIEDEFTDAIKDTHERLDVLGEHFTPVGSNQNSQIYEALTDWLSVHEDHAESTVAAINQAVASYQEHRERVQEQLREVDEELEPYEEMLALRDEVARVEDSLRKERDKLVRLEEINDRLGDLQDRHSELSTEIAEAHAKLHAAREEAAAAIQSFLAGDGDTDDADGELEVMVSPVTRGEDLARRLENMLDGRREKSGTLTPFTSTEGYLFEDDERHLEVLVPILSEVATAEEMTSLGFKNEYSAENVLTAITDDYFDIRYNLSYEGETVASMSPGQRGMVLLQFLLERSEADYPILLDQPEDNLDNRTIYDHVVEALRNRKTERQIIVVTHDPNLAVATDSEQLIVAEQSNEDEIDRGLDRFRYAMGALESDNLSTELDPEIETVRDWVCEILEGGADAFQHRHRRYNLPPINR